MLEIKQTDVFSEWLRALRDRAAKNRIDARISRLADGNAGQSRSVGGGVSELKIDCGPGYRVYFTRRGLTLILLLCGGDKSTQGRDIKLAQKLAQEWIEDENDGAQDDSV